MVEYDLGIADIDAICESLLGLPIGDGNNLHRRSVDYKPHCSSDRDCACRAGNERAYYGVGRSTGARCSRICATGLLSKGERRADAHGASSEVTFAEEIEQAMTEGPTPMFLLGLVSLAEKNPDTLRVDIGRAASRLYLKREMAQQFSQDTLDAQARAVLWRRSRSI
jgi:hypothetical protein